VNKDDLKERTKMLRALVIALAVLAYPVIGARAEPREATLYKNPQCSCCEEYAKYLRGHGYSVTVKATHDLPLIRRQLAVPESLDGCHTMVVDRYVVEGHVPVKTLNRLLTERPDIKGISLPGMPPGTPGMGGRKTAPFTIYEISKGTPKVYAVE
jgi:hypothetical protein